MKYGIAMKRTIKLFAVLMITGLLALLWIGCPKNKPAQDGGEVSDKSKTTPADKEMNSSLPDSVSYRHWINKKAVIHQKFIPIEANITKISDGNYLGKGDKILIHADFILPESEKLLEDLKAKQKEGKKLTKKELLQAIPVINPLAILDVENSSHVVVAQDLKILMNYNETKNPITYRYFQDPNKQGGYYSVVKNLKISENKKGILAGNGDITLYYIDNKGKANLLKTPPMAEVVGIDNSGGLLYRRFDKVILSDNGVGTYDTQASLGTGIWLYQPGIDTQPLVFPAQAWGILNPRGNAGLFYAQILHKESELWDFSIMPLLPKAKLQSIATRPKNQIINLADAKYFPLIWTGLSTFVTAVTPDDADPKSPGRRIVKVDLPNSLLNGKPLAKDQKPEPFKVTKLFDLKPQPEESIKIGPHTIMLSPQGDAIAFLFEEMTSENPEDTKMYLYVMGINDGTWARFKIDNIGYGSLSLMDWRKDGKQIAISAVMVKSDAIAKTFDEMTDKDIQSGIILITLK